MSLLCSDISQLSFWLPADKIDVYSLATFGKAIFIRISSIIMKKSEIVEGCCYKLDPVIENLDFIKKSTQDIF